MSVEYRVGIGYDIHRLVEGRRLVLGGVVIQHAKGLLGHSDADVIIHAVIDALAGASGLPDIGDLFPDTDPALRDADSAKLLTDVHDRVKAKGYRVVNVDTIVHAEAPRLTPYKAKIAGSMAKILGLPDGAVSVKAKTNEGMGSLGHADAIACTATALLARGA